MTTLRGSRDKQPGVELLREYGEAFSVGNDTPIVLNDESVWLVRSGQVAVFSVGMEDGLPVGGRTHLFRVAAGQALFGLGDAGAHAARTLLAVGTKGTRLLRVPRSRLREVAKQPEHTGRVAVLLEGWVDALCDGISKDAVPARCVELDPGGEIVMTSMASARPRKNVGWIKHLEGHSLLLGHDDLKVNGNGFLPLSRRVWVESRVASRIVVVDTATLLGREDLWAGLDALHSLVLRCVELMVERATTTERRRLRLKASVLRSTLSRACARLAATIEADVRGPTCIQLPPVTATGDVARLDDALLTVCRMVGRGLDIDIKTPVAAAGAPESRDPVESIARASRVRTRAVMLRGDWWREDNGPLLGYIADGRRPVALRPAPGGGRGYTLYDPLDATEQRVTSELAESLAPFAITFYRSFPEAALSITDVVRFGFQGCRREVRTVIGMTLVASLLGMVPPIATGVVFNTFIPGAQRSQLLQMTLVLLVCACSVAMFEITRGIALLRIEGKMGNAVQSAVWDRLLSLPMSFFRPYTAGELAVRAMGIDAIRQVISGSTVTAVVAGITSLGNFVLLFHYSTRLAWWAMLLITTALAVTGLGAYLQLSYQRGVSALQSRTAGIVLQLLSSIAKLRVAGAEAHAFASWAACFSEQRLLQFKVRTIGNWVAAFNAGFPTIAYMLIFWAALAPLTETHVMRTGDFLAFLSAFVVSLTGIVAMSNALLAMLLTVPLYEQAKPILVTNPEVSGDKEDPGELSGEIEIQHAMFRYQADGPLVLRDLTVRVAPGEFLAFVGPSGSGKSTILRLLLGFETLEAGSIYYDGREIGGLDVRAVRRQIGVVLQSGRLMTGDIYTNIVGSAPVAMETAWEAARMAGFADDIQQMPMGMHTVISEGGGTLSGGQRQRLMIARAIVHRPRILLFDEATSALDNRTQVVVSASLERLQATRIVIAHRLSTIMHADRICVVQHGQVVQSGSYDDLMQQGGLFAELARRQLA